MKAEEIIKLAQEFAKLNSRPTADGKPRRQRAPRYMKHMRDEDLVARLQKTMTDFDTLTQVIEDRQKAKKKEDKKPEKMSVFQVAVLLMAGYPIIAALGVLFWWMK